MLQLRFESTDIFLLFYSLLEEERNFFLFKECKWIWCCIARSLLAVFQHFFGPLSDTRRREVVYLSRWIKNPVAFKILALCQWSGTVLLASKFKTVSCPLLIRDWPISKIPNSCLTVYLTDHEIYLAVSHTISYQVHWWGKLTTAYNSNRISNELYDSIFHAVPLLHVIYTYKESILKKVLSVK